jgi:hypothetical protein
MDPVVNHTINQAISPIHAHGSLAFALTFQRFIMEARGFHYFRKSIGLDQKDPKNDLFPDEVWNPGELLFKGLATGNFGANFHPI